MEKTEKFRMRRYSIKRATNIYAAPMRGINNSLKCKYTTQHLLRITFSTSCQHSPGRSIFKFLARLRWTFIRALNLKVSAFSLFPFFQNMRPSTDTPKKIVVTTIRVGGPSGCTFSFTLVLIISLSQKSFLFRETWISKG